MQAVAGDGLAQGRLVLIDREDVIGAVAHDLLRNRGLTVHRIDGHDGPADLQEAQQPGDARDVVGFLRGDNLPQGHFLRVRPGAHDIQCGPAIATIVRAAQAFAVDRHHFTVLDLCDGLRPGDEGFLERAGGNPRHHLTPKISGGDAVVIGRNRPSHTRSSRPEVGNDAPAIGAAHHGPDAQQQILFQGVEFVLVGAWVLDRRQMRDQIGGYATTSSCSR